MPPSYVKPYVKRQKNDAADAEAICEAVTRPTMRFVEIKSPVQQSVQGLHRVRLMLIRQRTQLAYAIRGHMAEYGLVAPVGRNGLAQLVNIITDTDDDRVPETIRSCLAMLVAQLGLVNRQILETDRRVAADARASETDRRLMKVPGVGPVLASAIVAAVPDPKAFKSGRNLAAWIGLVPRQNSSGGRKRLGGITKQGDRYLPAVAGRRSALSRPPGHAARHQALLAGAAVGSPNAEDRCGRTRQQDRPHHLGEDDHWGSL